MSDSAEPAATVESLFDAHFATLVRFAYRRTGDRELAEDLAAECFIRALKHPDPSTIQVGWLVGTARNLIGDQYRRRDREKRVLTLLATSVTDSHLDRYDDTVVIEMLAALSARDRELLMLLHVDGLPAHEVAIALGISPAAVWKRSSRAKGRLRALYAHSRHSMHEGSVITVEME